MWARTLRLAPARASVPFCRASMPSLCRCAACPAASPSSARRRCHAASLSPAGIVAVAALTLSPPSRAQLHSRASDTSSGTPLSQVLTRPSHLRRVSSDLGVLFCSPPRNPAGDSPSCSPLGHSSPRRGVHTSRDPPPFLQRKKGKAKSEADGLEHDSSKPAASSSTAAPAAASPPLPSHIHSATCGCSSDDLTILPDDQRILDESEDWFLNDMHRSVSALHAMQDSLEKTEALPEPRMGLNGEHRSKWSLAALMEHNHKFVVKQQYEPFLTDRFPYKKLVIVTCMDTRLTALLPAALDLQNGDAKIIKVAGAMVAHPFGSVMRSIMVAVYALGAEHILVIGHHDCGMTGMDPKKILAQARARGIPDSTFKTLQAAGLDLDNWLSGFESVENSVRHSVRTIKNHPLLAFTESSVKESDAQRFQPLDSGSEVSVASAGASASVAKRSLPKITVTGLVICPTSGRLDLVTPAEDSIEQMVAQHKQEREQLENAGKLKKFVYAGGH